MTFQSKKKKKFLVSLLEKVTYNISYSNRNKIADNKVECYMLLFYLFLSFFKIVFLIVKGGIYC